jgi:peptide chain release factor 3
MPERESSVRDGSAHAELTAGGVRVRQKVTPIDVQMKYAHQLFADQRDTVDRAVAGDIVGVVNATDIQVGDTLYDPDGPPVRFPRIPTFAPERFVRIRNGSSGKAKQFRKGIHQLDEEGVVLVMRDADLGDQEPILAGVGQLQGVQELHPELPLVPLGLSPQHMSS